MEVIMPKPWTFTKKRKPKSRYEQFRQKQAEDQLFRDEGIAYEQEHQLPPLTNYVSHLQLMKGRKCRFMLLRLNLGLDPQETDACRWIGWFKRWERGRP